MKTRRTARKDSTFILYEVVASDGNNYIGLTRKGSTTVARAVAERWRKHKSRARNEQRAWALYEHLRNGGLAMEWEHKILAIVRGRAEAYAQERSVVKLQRPTLNTQYT
jgi:predicted GIY-YIG superfamily endonuclease